ncbi:ion transporter [Streptomyces cupreus]|uniref:ion transporter n=1 Tax=Streptomyces cupreus TaxID=2759956 RepID=UPI0021B1B920|nr:ion transporter [Streptomyces cupreus]
MPDHHDPGADRTALSARQALALRCRSLTEARWFALTVFAVILANAALLGVETYSGLAGDWHLWLRLAEYVCQAAFTAEILVRLAAHAARPREFFKDPWNLFDLAVVLCAFLPVVRENTTVLRLRRLARVLRTARFLPQLRVVLVDVGRSLPGALSFLLVGALLLYVYAMLGWVFFSHRDPGHYGSLGRAVLTLVLLMTLDGIGDAVHADTEVSWWSLLYYVSYVLLPSFVLVNVLIGVVITRPRTRPHPGLLNTRPRWAASKKDQQHREHLTTTPHRPRTDPGRPGGTGLPPRCPPSGTAAPRLPDGEGTRTRRPLPRHADGAGTAVQFLNVWMFTD